MVSLPESVVILDTDNSPKLDFCKSSSNELGGVNRAEPDESFCYQQRKICNIFYTRNIFHP